MTVFIITSISFIAQAFVEKDIVTINTFIFIVVFSVVLFLLINILQRLNKKTKSYYGVVLSFIICVLMALSMIFISFNERLTEHFKSTLDFLSNTEEYRALIENENEVPYTVFFNVFKSEYDFVIDYYVKVKKNTDYTKINMPEWGGAKEVFYSKHETYVVYDDYVISFYSNENITREIFDSAIKV